MAFVQKRLDSGGGFGANLQEIRELRGLTRQELSERTQIHVSIIRALEENNLSDLKDPVYAERHVHALVKELEGRPGYFLKKYRELLKAYEVEKKDRILVRPLVRRRDFFVPSRFIALVGLIGVALIAGGYLSWQAFLLQDPPPIEVTSPEDNVMLHEPFIDVRGQTLANVIVTVNGRRAVVERDGSFYIRLDVPRGSTTLTIEAKRRYGSSVQMIRRVIYEFEDEDEE